MSIILARILYAWFRSAIHLYFDGSFEDPLFLYNIIKFSYAKPSGRHSLRQIAYVDDQKKRLPYRGWEFDSFCRNTVQPYCLPVRHTDNRSIELCTRENWGGRTITGNAVHRGYALFSISFLEFFTKWPLVFFTTQNSDNCLCTGSRKNTEYRAYQPCVFP